MCLRCESGKVLEIDEGLNLFTSGNSVRHASICFLQAVCSDVDDFYLEISGNSIIASGEEKATHQGRLRILYN